MKTNFWVSNAADESADAVPSHHDNTACIEGNTIEQDTRRNDVDNRPLWGQCADPNEAERQLPAFPWSH